MNVFKNFIKHETKRRVLIKFLLLLTVLIGYFVFLSFKYGIGNGFTSTILTWSFFVFCTPIADAGFLLDFPIRLITRVRMLYSEIFVWVLAAAMNIYLLSANPSAYETTGLLQTFRQILTNPYPFWSIILISLAGTFLSIYFGDELIDVIKHHEREKFMKHKAKYAAVLSGFILLITLIIFSYGSLIHSLGVNLFEII